jgi:23S rRNA (cytosine1962-C5)-methyltransferase
VFTFSCSGGISADLFHKIVASAGADAGVDGYILSAWGRPTTR